MQAACIEQPHCLQTHLQRHQPVVDEASHRHLVVAEDDQQQRDHGVGQEQEEHQRLEGGHLPGHAPVALDRVLSHHQRNLSQAASAATSFGSVTEPSMTHV
jgi:hypothetical protein